VLANGGSVVTYGAMSRQPVKIPTGLLIFKDLRFRGFWVTNWYKTASPEDRQAMFSRLFDFAKRGLIKTPVEKIYPVSEIREAVLHANRAERSGKILLGAG
jgi:NADPH:quinone reductase-like Zn-dependent oxidoreductase